MIAYLLRFKTKKTAIHIVIGTTVVTNTARSSAGIGNLGFVTSSLFNVVLSSVATIYMYNYISYE